MTKALYKSLQMAKKMLSGDEKALSKRQKTLSTDDGETLSNLS